MFNRAMFKSHRLSYFNDIQKIKVNVQVSGCPESSCNTLSILYGKDRFYVVIVVEYIDFLSIDFFPFLKKNSKDCFVNISNTEYRAVIKLFIRKGLSTIDITKELADVYDDYTPSYCIVAKWVAEFNNPTRSFKDAP